MSNPERANTTMVNLLLGLDPMSLSRFPYIPVVNNLGILTAQDIGLHINPLEPVYCLPSVGSFIGGTSLPESLSAGCTVGRRRFCLWTSEQTEKSLWEAGSGWSPVPKRQGSLWKAASLPTACGQNRERSIG